MDSGVFPLVGYKEYADQAVLVLALFSRPSLLFQQVPGSAVYDFKLLDTSQLREMYARLQVGKWFFVNKNTCSQVQDVKLFDPTVNIQALPYTRSSLTIASSGSRVCVLCSSLIMKDAKREIIVAVNNVIYRLLQVSSGTR